MHKQLIGGFSILLLVLLLSLSLPQKQVSTEPISIDESILQTIEVIDKTQPSIPIPLGQDPIIEKVHVEVLKSIEEKDSDDLVELIVEVNEDNFDDVIELIEDNGGSITDTVELGASIIANVPVESVETITDNENVEGLWPDREYSVLLTDSIEQLGVEQAWINGFDGSGVRIAVLDTGIDLNHESFSNSKIIHDIFTGEDSIQDLHGHGTQVAGIIGADGSIKGIAPDAYLLIGKVLNNQGGGSTSTIIQGIEWAVEQDADIISMSIGGYYNDPDGPINKALQEAIDQGIIVVISAGNCGSECPSPKCGSFRGVTTPGDFAEAITVGAVDKNNDWACFSSYQNFQTYSKPDFVAPGVDIVTTQTGSLSGQFSGTSAAAPHVAGLIAVLKEEDPTISSSNVKSVLESRVTPFDGSEKFGEGLIHYVIPAQSNENSINLFPYLMSCLDSPDLNLTADTILYYYPQDCTDCAQFPQDVTNPILSLNDCLDLSIQNPIAICNNNFESISQEYDATLFGNFAQSCIISDKEKEVRSERLFSEDELDNIKQRQAQQIQADSLGAQSNSKYSEQDLDYKKDHATPSLKRAAHKRQRINITVQTGGEFEPESLVDVEEIIKRLFS